MRSVTATLTLAALGLALVSPVSAATVPGSPSADFRAVAAGPAITPDARRMADRVTASGDNGGAPFLIVDKRAALLFAFDGDGGLVAGAAVLLGLAGGDDAPADIGSRPLSRIGPADRITPAGRFVASQGLNLQGKTVLWIDYDAALSLHIVVTVPSDRRRERLASATASDNRISFGCINVAADVYAGVIGPLFSTNIGVVYILPEVRTVAEVFAGMGVAR